MVYRCGGGQSSPEGTILVYLLRCRDGTLYCGWTDNLARRLAAHNSGKGARYTKGRLPVQALCWWACENKSAALRLEAKIKKLHKTVKEALAQNPALLNDLL